MSTERIHRLRQEYENLPSGVMLAFCWMAGPIALAVGLMTQNAYPVGVGTLLLFVAGLGTVVRREVRRMMAQ